MPSCGGISVCQSKDSLQRMVSGSLKAARPLWVRMRDQVRLARLTSSGHWLCWEQLIILPASRLADMYLFTRCWQGARRRIHHG